MPRVLVGAVVLVLALAGCGADPKADPSPSPSTTTASPVSTTPAPPVLPEAAKANTKAGAIAFVKYYVELINHAQATGDVGPLAAVEDPGCESCAKGRAYISRIYGGGGHVSGGSWLVSRATAQRSGENWAVTVTGKFLP